MIDDKLNEILHSFYLDLESYKFALANLDGSKDRDQQYKAYERAVAEIKQAFAEAGYVHIDRYSGGGIQVKGGVLMTGQEFYDKFKKIIISQSNDALKNHPAGAAIIPQWSSDDILEAARKAAGLEKEDE